MSWLAKCLGYIGMFNNHLLGNKVQNIFVEKILKISEHLMQL